MTNKIGFLVSSELGLHCLKHIDNTIKPQFIFTDKNSIGIIQYAEINKIPVFIGNPRKKDSTSFLKKFDTDIIFSINYLFIVNDDVLDFPKIHAINFHGSLLPKYRGRTPHVWAIINGEKETGITAHLMEKGCDTGDIVLQERIEINSSATGNDILHIYKEKYPLMVEKILDMIDHKKLVIQKQNDREATYFGKRTPEDGHINWDWQKERINNWVRAQAMPYPGAFCYLNGEKIIIDKIGFTNFGYDNQMPNGLIIQTEPEILVKTPNGVVKLLQIREQNTISFNVNDQLI